MQQSLEVKDLQQDSIIVFFPVGNPAPVEDKTTGKIILLFARDSKNILKLESMDDGVTWGSVEDITRMVMDPTWPAMDTGPPGGIQLPSGRLIICN